MERDPRIRNASEAILRLSREMVNAGPPGGGITPAAVANEIAFALGKFLSQHFSPTQAAAMLREQAGKVDPPDRKHLTPGEAELLELGDKAQQFINTLQIAGIEESTAVTALA